MARTEPRAEAPSTKDQLTKIFTDDGDTAGATGGTDGNGAASRPSLGTRLKYACVIRRVEFLPGHIPQVIGPAMLGAASWGEFASLNSVLAMLWMISGLQIGNMINALADREVDLQLKSRQSDAIYGIGVSRVITHIALSTALFVAVAAFLAVRTQHWDLLAYAAAFLVLAFSYSLPPLFLKSSGAPQLPTLQVTCCLIPGIAIVRSFDGATDWTLAFTIVGIAMLVTSLFVTSHAEDYVEDAKFGIRTYVHAFGLTGTMLVQSAMLFFGSIIVLGTVWAQSGLNWGFVPFIIAWAMSQRLMWAATSVARRAPLDEAMEYFHKKSLLGPYHSALMSWTLVILAAFTV
ncbi:UbiA family prenyltransferase [Streptomyces sp. NA04227]|uniref:UbiA family prenyltransferase n=1 Tax=Streptomyces sp. NA04227 TaxID=2742136 RepID=UPI0015903501|nr:UbiA family prenyltransferase [Streptomyces sp. NA04227]QKW06563.1 UbiA family prenyltransferase [Streptomyces sp. NA04227]